MSQNLTRLCALLIEDLYGPFYSKIFSTLSTFGRLSATNIAQKCRIPLRQIRSGLGLLVQMRLVYHHTTLEGRTTYEANIKTAYNLLRTGRIIQTARRRFGHHAAQVMKKLLQLGHVTVRQLEVELRSEELREAHQLVNGEQRSKPIQNGFATGLHDSLGNPPVRKILRRLAQEQFILEVRQSSFQTWADAYNDAEAYIRGSQITSSTKGKKSLQELAEKTGVEMESRTRADIFGPAKRTKLLDDIAVKDSSYQWSNSSHDVEDLDDDLIICVNYEKAVAMLRIERLAKEVARKFGVPAGYIFGAALLQVDSRLYKMIAQTAGGERSYNVDNYNILDMGRLLLDVNTVDSPAPDDFARPRGVSRMHVKEVDHVSGLQENGHANGNSQTIHEQLVDLEFIEQQLQIMAEEPLSLLKFEPSSGKWGIDLRRATDQLRNLEISALVKSRLGPTAMRIIRMLDEKGKLDEKSLQEYGLFSAKDLRQCLARLKSQGFIELQEVPREPQRQPNRTIYLWFYDALRVQNVLCEDLCKAMVKVLQRINLERRRIRSTLEKVERSDVRGNEERLLAPGEMTVLRRWRKRERWLLAELDRLDGTVAMLREV